MNLNICFCMGKNTVIWIKLQYTEWIFTNFTSDRGLISKAYKEIKKFYIKIFNNQI